MRVGPDGDHHALRLGLPHQTQVHGAELCELRFIAHIVFVEVTRVDLDGHAAFRAGVDQFVFIALEHGIVGPVAELRGNVEVPDDVAGLLLDRIEERLHVDLPRAFGADDVEEIFEFRVVERPHPVFAVLRVRDR